MTVLPLDSCVRATVLAGLSLLLASTASSAATLPPNFSESLVAGGLGSPTAMDFAPDGRIFVCEQTGSLRVIKNGTLLPAPFVTLTTDSRGERGLLGIALDPAFAVNHYVYVYYTATTPNAHNRVSRFTADGDVALDGSETILVDLDPLNAEFAHNGGAIHFGPDGKLYIAVGENANPSNSQTLTSRLGKMLRINADGSIPADNPFFNTATGANRSIWALGLRNPFTFAFQPLADTMFINDVGLTDWEEVNLGVKGANYGWPITEGPTTNPAFASPLYAYDHTGGECAITGGAFHSLLLGHFPAKYWGGYFFSDICGGWIRFRSSTGSVSTFATDISAPVDLRMLADGSLYYLSAGLGAVYRITYGPVVPTVDLTVGGTDGPAAFGSADPLEIAWSFDGGGGLLNPVEIYIGVLTSAGLHWFDPTQGLVQTLARAYVGPIQSFTSVPLISLPAAGILPHGPHLWIVIIDNDSDGVPEGDASDTLLTILN